MINTVIHGDCLIEMQRIADKSVDMILCDLPYGTTACKWDIIIPFEPLWEQYKRIIKDNGAIVLTASEPFASKLRLSNIGKKKSEKARKNMSIAKTGTKDSEETKLKKRLSHLGKKQSQEEIEKRRRTRCKKLYMIITPENVVVYTISISDYCSKNNLHTSHMYAVANGKKSHFKGYRIMEIDRE
jgi:predicted methyltransferase